MLTVRVRCGHQVRSRQRIGSRSERRCRPRRPVRRRRRQICRPAPGALRWRERRSRHSGCAPVRCPRRWPRAWPRDTSAPGSGCPRRARRRFRPRARADSARASLMYASMTQHVLLDEGAIEPAGALEFRRQRPGQHHVRPRTHGEVQVRLLGDLDAPRIDHHELGAVVLGGVDLPHQVQVAGGGVVAPDDDQLGEARPAGAACRDSRRRCRRRPRCGCRRISGCG